MYAYWFYRLCQSSFNQFTGISFCGHFLTVPCTYLIIKMIVWYIWRWWLATYFLVLRRWQWEMVVKIMTKQNNIESSVTQIVFYSISLLQMYYYTAGMYPRITKLIFDEWQEVWNCCTGNKLHAIRPTVGDYKQKTCLSRHDSVSLNRLRIGHTSFIAFLPTLRWWFTWMWYLSVPTNSETHSGWMAPKPTYNVLVRGGGQRLSAKM